MTEKAEPILVGKGFDKDKLEALQKKIKKVIDQNQIEKGINALLNLYKEKKSNNSGKKELFAEDQLESDDNFEVDYESYPIEKDPERIFFLALKLKKLDEKYYNTLAGRPIEIPHPFIRPNKNVDVFLTVPGENDVKVVLEYIKENESAKESLQALSCVKNVISLKHLQTAYPTFESKKVLHFQHDLFLAEGRIIPQAAKALGQRFLKGSKILLNIDLTSKIPPKLPDDEFYRRKRALVIDYSISQVDESIRNVIEQTYFFPRGPCTDIRVARIGMRPEEIIANIYAVLAAVSTYIDDGFEGIQSVSLRTGESIGLPLLTATIDEHDLDKDDAFDESNIRIVKALKNKQKRETDQLSKLEKSKTGSKEEGISRQAKKVKN